MMQSWSAGPPPRDQSYQVSCPEGHRLSGLRTEGYQALRCPTCGEGIFVLPRSPLPEPMAPSSPSRSRVEAVVEAFPDDGPMALTDPSPMTTSNARKTATDEPEVEIDWVDESPPETNADVEIPEPEAEPAPRPTPTRPKPRTRPVPEVPVVPRTTLAERARRHPTALISVGVVVLVLMAVLIRSRRQRLEELPRIAEIGRTEGLRKLDLGEFHAAKKLLTDASSAVDGLSGRFEGAEAIRQGALEAAIFTDLVPEPLDRLLEQAATFPDGKEWSSRFASMYRGRSIILETPITEVPNPLKPGSSYQVEGRVYFGPGPRPVGQARIDLTGFRLFELAEPKLGDLKTFGARLAALELDAATNVWVLTLEPDSGVFITHHRALEALGWPSPESLEEPRP